jgi:hypothetical protein
LDQDLGSPEPVLPGYDAGVPCVPGQSVVERGSLLAQEFQGECPREPVPSRCDIGRRAADRFQVRPGLAETEEQKRGTGEGLREQPVGLRQGGYAFQLGQGQMAEVSEIELPEADQGPGNRLVSVLWLNRLSCDRQLPVVMPATPRCRERRPGRTTRSPSSWPAFSRWTSWSWPSLPMPSSSLSLRLISSPSSWPGPFSPGR